MTRLSLLLSIALIVTAPCALAQTYEIGSQMTGEPRSSAQFGDEDQRALSELSVAQIAADVTSRVDARTGKKDYLAPTFDPFEADDALAGAVNLRSTDGAFDLYGTRLVDGALLDVSLFYSQAGDRHLDLSREAMFLNGSPASRVWRDRRELDCSSRVIDQVYPYARYGNNVIGEFGLTPLLPRSDPATSDRGRSDLPTTIVRPYGPRSKPNNGSRGDHNRVPGRGYNGGIIVSTQRDCAWQDQLVFFIPNDRLKDARLEGLTLILRDVTYDARTGQATVYDERPLYIPPNYIEGFRVGGLQP